MTDFVSNEKANKIRTGGYLLLKGYAHCWFFVFLCRLFWSILMFDLSSYFPLLDISTQLSMSYYGNPQIQDWKAWWIENEICGAWCVHWKEIWRHDYPLLAPMFWSGLVGLPSSPPPSDWCPGAETVEVPEVKKYDLRVIDVDGSCLTAFPLPSFSLPSLISRSSPLYFTVSSRSVPPCLVFSCYPFTAPYPLWQQHNSLFVILDNYVTGMGSDSVEKTIPLPTSTNMMELANEIRDKFADEQPIIVTVLCSVGKEGIIRCRPAKPSTSDSE